MAEHVYSCRRTITQRVAVSAFAFANLIGACRPGPSPCDRVCKIFEDNAGKAPSVDLDVQMAMRIEREVPEIERGFSVVAQVSGPQRYGYYKQIARETCNQPQWTCEAIRKFYASLPKPPDEKPRSPGIENALRDWR